MTEKLRTLGEVLEQRAQAEPDLSIFRFWDDRGAELPPLSFGELDAAARTIGALLQAMGAARQPVLLAFEPGRAFVEAFFGCIYAGATAVPAHRPRPAASLRRLEAIALDCGAKHALCDRASLPGPDLPRNCPVLGRVRFTAIDATFGNVGSLWKDPGLAPEDLCFLQYTSGSTGTPKGVMVSHQNLLHNLGAIREAFGLSEEDRGFFWLPPFHDMGLIGGILTPVFVQMPSILVPPRWFARKPERWPEAIAANRISVSGAPNFAYELSAERSSGASLDLSCWDVAFVGAEPIRHDTLQRFARTYAAHGFRSDALYPCYGMAEGTLLVTGGGRRARTHVAHVDRAAYREDRVLAADARPDALPLVGCGRAWGGQSVLIVDPESARPVADGAVGEIWVHGPSVSRGYFGNPELSRELMHAELAAGAAPDRPRGPYLRTGDKGFLRDGQLYVAGRIKDMIIVRGRNYYSEDIEHTVRSAHADFAGGDGAAFSLQGDTRERLVVVHELARAGADSELLWEAARRAVTEGHGIALDELVLIRRLTLPRTTSGKVQRFEVRRRHLEGRLSVLAQHRAVPAERPVNTSLAQAAGVQQP